MANLPNLYLKWQAFRSLIGDARSNADIGRIVFEDEGGGPIKFSKMLYGDYGCRPDIAAELVDVINRCITAYRQDQGLDSNNSNKIIAHDLSRPTYDFVRHLINVAGEVEPGRLADAHHQLFSALSATPAHETNAQLTIERYAIDRAIGPMEPSGGRGPTTFVPDKHTGQFSISGIKDKPAAVYALVARDTSSAGAHLWDCEWGDTVLWLPSPFVPTWDGEIMTLLPAPGPIQPIPGLFAATVVIVFDKETIRELDPRGHDPQPAALDETQTARFLTNMRQLSKRKSSPIAVVSNKYEVVVDSVA